MQTLPDYFDLLLSRIEPKGERKDCAREIPAKVRDFLKESDDIETVEPHSLLAGSYARHTAIKDIKDVDIILFVSPDYRDESPEKVLDKLYSALNDLPKALGDTGEIVSRRHQRRSVNVHLDKQDFDLDIVPAVAPDGSSKPLEIPDKDWSKWVPTHPLGYGDKLSKLNEAHKDKVVPLVKMLKHWRDVHMIYKRPKSYWLECMVYHRIANGVLLTDDTSYAELFRDLLSSIHKDYAPKLDEAGVVPQVKDPMLGHNVAHNWERSDFESFMRRVDESRKWAERAIEQDDEAKAIELWKKVFGDEWFPNKADVASEKAASLRAAALAGGVFVTPTGRVYTDRPTGHSVQAPSQRFYGGG